MIIRDLLRSHHVRHQSLLHSPSPTAAHLAQSLHVTGDRVAKTVLIQADGRNVLAVLPATHRINLERMAEFLGAREVVIASEDEVESVFHDCQRGAIPPFGSVYGLQTVVDSGLSNGREIVIEGNLRHEGVRLRYQDFEMIEHPSRARFAEPIMPRRKKPSHRQAG